MISISYTITPTITDHLIAIDAHRRTILTTPLSPRNEQRLHWDSIIGHITASLALANTTIPKSQIVTILTHPSKHPTATEQLVLSYKRALDWLHEEWSANPKTITFPVVETLASIALPAHSARAALRDDEENIRHLLTYLQSQSDHPILVAGLAHGQIASSSNRNLSSGLICRLTTALILAKYGYDCRGMLAIDPFWTENRERYDRALESINRLGQLTAWLEYFTGVAQEAYDGLAEEISHAAAHLPISTWLLAPREDQIMHRLDSPTSRITNRDVQRSFHISQVTASRVLTRLVSLGLLFAHGKGRSVYYTKA